MVGPNDGGKLKETDAIKFMKVIDPFNSGKIVQISLVDTGETLTDGTPIHALGIATPPGAGLFKKRQLSKITDSVIDDVVIPSGGTVEGALQDFSTWNGEGAVTVIAEYDPAATAGISADILGVPESGNQDTPGDPYMQDLEPSFATGEKRQRTHNIDVWVESVKARIVNLDPVNSVTVKVIWSKWL